MSDILRQLKHCASKPMRNLETFPAICSEAAATIERLTKEREDEGKCVKYAEDDYFKVCVRADSLAAELAKVTKERDEARLQDPNQWRREYWGHYNDLKARADTLAAELAQAKQERDDWQMQTMALQSQLAGDVERQSERNYWAGQKAELAKTRKALKPFAAFAKFDNDLTERWEGRIIPADDAVVLKWEGGFGLTVEPLVMGDFRFALEVLPPDGMCI